MPYPDKTQFIPHKVVVEHESLFSSNGLQETTEENHLYPFSVEGRDIVATSVSFTAVSNAINIKFAGMKSWVYVPRGMTFFFNNVHFTGVRIAESGVTFAFHGGFY